MVRHRRAVGTTPSLCGVGNVLFCTDDDPRDSERNRHLFSRHSRADQRLRAHHEDDSIADIRSVYGLVQSKEGLRKILTAIGNSGSGSFLAVLKLFGEQDSGLISFPMKGYTLALDFPMRKGLFEFLDKLDVLVLEHGGRIYLTKDARMKKEVFWDSYQQAKEFEKVVLHYNPNLNFRSSQSDRLAITKL